MILLVIFSPGLYWTKRRFDLKEKSLGGGNDEEKKRIAALEKERKLLVERIGNLESIVCSTDYELNLQIARLAAAQEAAGALPPASAEGAAKESAAKEGARKGGSVQETLLAGAATAAGAVGRREHGSANLQEQAAALRAVHTAAAELPVHTVLGNRYRIDRLLGRGGMGVVYLASDETLHEQVALKLIAARWSHDRQGMIDRFRREASFARKVSSPHVIRIHDLGETDDGLLYISMEYFQGKTLAEIVDEAGPLGKADTRAIIGQICEGLGAAHAAGVIHRDLKPQNVLVNERNQVKLIDFGLAKTSFMAGMTATGLMVGTPYYMSPEQVRGTDVDARSDIYSLGALTYYAVTGRPPFEGDNPIAVGFAHLSEEPTPPRERNPAISADLNAMILSALAKDPRDRPRSPGAFGKAL